MTLRTVRALVAAVVLGGAVAYWAGSVFDGPDGFELGTWARLWGGTAALVGLGLGAGGRLGRAVVAAVTGLVAALFWFVIVAWRVPPLTLEGAWMWPLAAGATIGSVAAGRSLDEQDDRP